MAESGPSSSYSRCESQGSQGDRQYLARWGNVGRGPEYGRGGDCRGEIDFFLFTHFFLNVVVHCLGLVR